MKRHELSNRAYYGDDNEMLCGEYDRGAKMNEPKDVMALVDEIDDEFVYAKEHGCVRPEADSLMGSLHSAIEELVKERDEPIRLCRVCKDDYSDYEIGVCDADGDELDVEVKADAILCDIEKLRKERDMANENLRRAVNSVCTCGGGGPDDGCPACKVWHLMGGKP